MLKVLRHGNKTSVKNPIDGTFQEMVNVVFIEEGRSGGNSSMSDTSSFLSKISGGGDVGLATQRTHTHPVKADKIDLFPLGKKFPGHINRRLFSTPQIRQQENVYSRMVDGKPTYFVTEIGEVEKEDLDLRMSNDTLVQISPDYFRNTRTGTAEVNILEGGLLEQLVPQGDETLAS